MNVHEYRFLLADRGALMGLISETRPDEVITRMSFEHRLNQVEEELKAYKGRSPEVVQARVTFRGKPVSGARGMSARLFGESLERFAVASHYVGASVKMGALPPAGPVPHGKDYELLLADTLRGSFGFRVEDASGIPAWEGEDTPVGEAIGKVKAILEASKEGGEQLSAATAGVDARALRAVEKFLRLVADGGAGLSLEFRMDICEFADAAQVSQSADRLAKAADARAAEAGHVRGSEVR